MTESLGVGIIGCGSISGIYLRNLTAFESVRPIACADRIRERAEDRAREFGVLHVLTVDEMLADDEIDIIVNLTTPDAHADIASAAIRAGKHVYNEKPLTIELEDAQQVLAWADDRHLRVGCAPDTFLGAGITTCRALIDGGAIGRPVAASAFFGCPGHELWHPDPAFYYLRGGGPVFDMGPYYLTALITLLGPVRRVCGIDRRTHEHRTILSDPQRGETIPVEVPTHAAAVLEFVSGPIASVVMSFDIHPANTPMVRIYGSEATLAVPDPNMFDGPVELYEPGADAWRTVDLIGRYARNSRGLGIAEMADAIRTDRPHRASGELAMHILDIMHAIRTSSETRAHVDLRTTCGRPLPLPPQWRA
jgi:predicted dehydrogenase